jgi:hypothetical protein
MLYPLVLPKPFEPVGRQYGVAPCAIRATSSIMETKPPVPRAILVGIQVPSVDDIAHAAGIEELSRLVKTLGYEVVGTMSQKRDELDGATVLGKGRLEELAAITGGTGVVGSTNGEDYHESARLYLRGISRRGFGKDADSDSCAEQSRHH